MTSRYIYLHDGLSSALELCPMECAHCAGTLTLIWSFTGEDGRRNKSVQMKDWINGMQKPSRFSTFRRSFTLPLALHPSLFSSSPHFCSSLQSEHRNTNAPNTHTRACTDLKYTCAGVSERNTLWCGMFVCCVLQWTWENLFSESMRALSTQLSTSRTLFRNRQ